MLKSKALRVKGPETSGAACSGQNSATARANSLPNRSLFEHVTRPRRVLQLVASVCLCALFSASSLSPVYGEYSPTKAGETLQASGHYLYIFSNGAPPATNDYHFVAFTGPNGWKISITNIVQPKEWGIVRYDGTNIYMIGTDQENNYQIYGYVYPGHFYVPEASQDSVKPFFPWMACYLTPQMIKEVEQNDIPPPWIKRFSMADCGGYKWETHFFENGRIIQRIDWVRDSTLDFKTLEEELRRPSVNYPFEYSSLEHRIDTLSLRKEVPDGFVRATYKCNDFFKTNDWIVPTAASFTIYWPNIRDPQGPIRLQYYMELQVEKINLLQKTEMSEIISPATMGVHDYRYQATNNRTKFNYANYTLKAGDAFPPSNDPMLLAQAEDWLKHGPAFNNVQSKRKKILAGMLTITFVVSGLLIFWLSRKEKQ